MVQITNLGLLALSLFTPLALSSPADDRRSCSDYIATIDYPVVDYTTAFYNATSVATVLISVTYVTTSEAVARTRVRHSEVITSTCTEV
ncbi:hypothetical protein N431DRAFT_430130 [Stipitochalara longipes BDJ]|nr:hypothetical protein N431DRAFT_430130 [Stipitochalara longipes BDJ]